MVLNTEIKKLYKTGKYTYKQLAKKYNVDLTTIGDIINNKTWKKGGTDAV